MSTATENLLDIKSAIDTDKTFWVGIDVGSTTVKTAIIDPQNLQIISWNYLRHNACQLQTIYQLMDSIDENFKDAHLEIAICGSGAKTIVDKFGATYIQEVIATSYAIQEIYPTIRTAIELGGQDSKIMVFDGNPQTGKSTLLDMRMNGSCAGGTGAFIDQMAALIEAKVEEFNAVALKGRKVHPISGRCGVFAKSDILPLLNMGIPKPDIALSVCYSLVNQTLASLAHGLEILQPIAFLGGPLTFNPVLVNAYIEKLGILKEDCIVPCHSQIMAAIGAALFIGQTTANKRHSKKSRRQGITRKFTSLVDSKQVIKDDRKAFFSSDAEYVDFITRHSTHSFLPIIPKRGSVLNAFAGIDAGSTTLKIVLIDSNAQVVNKWYGNNTGDTLGVARTALLEMKDFYKKNGVELHIRGLGTTGYGEMLCAQAFGADYHTVETIAHAAGTLSMYPDATFILDIGGQDMKAMTIDHGVILDVFLNEACSSGCGSFIETTANKLGIPTQKIADMAFESCNTASLGSRCTVFMLSSITSEQRNGKSVEDLIAGLCRSIIENVFEKVIRISDVQQLGGKIIVQGGTFKNDAILRAFEQYVGEPVLRPEYCGEMGAYGIALLTKKELQSADRKCKPTSFIGFNVLQEMGRPKTVSSICNGCGNRCNRDILIFENGLKFCAGHRCPKGDESEGHPHTNVVKKNRMSQGMSMPSLKEKLLLVDEDNCPQLLPSNGKSIGIPLVFEFWNSLPFWRALFKSLGFKVDVSGKSSQMMVQCGNKFAASDSICFPAKLMHGHIETLIERRVDRLFVPAMKTLSGNHGHTTIHMCPVLQGLPIMVRHLNRPWERKKVGIEAPVFAFTTEKLREEQIILYLHTSWGISRKIAKQAIKHANSALTEFRNKLKKEFKRILYEIESGDKFGIMLLMRPYHADSLVNHHISELFNSMGISVLSSDYMPTQPEFKTVYLRPEMYNPFHTDLYTAALYAARNPKLEVVQLVSFGCGHDAITCDEIHRIMGSVSTKKPLVLKIDDGKCTASLKVRIRSFVETILSKRSRT